MSTTEAVGESGDKPTVIIRMYSRLVPKQDIMTETRLNVNHPDVWPKLAQSVVAEVCSNAVQYTPVPELLTDGQTFLPMQIFTDKTTLSSNALVRLARKQKQLPTNYIKDNWWRRLWTRDDVTSSCHDVIFDESDIWTDSPVSCIIEQKKTRSKYFPEPDDIVAHKTQFSIDVKDVHVRKVDPKNLHDVVFGANSPITHMKLKSFNFIYETYIAKEVACSVCVSHGGNSTSKSETIRNTPIAFRYAEVKLDNINSVKGLKFDTKNATRQILSKQYIVIPSQHIIQDT